VTDTQHPDICTNVDATARELAREIKTFPSSLGPGSVASSDIVMLLSSNEFQMK
jgi:hypothetical protein